MADNFRKTPLGRSLNQIAVSRALDTIQLLGKALPASIVSSQGSIVTVKFEVNSVYTLPQVKMPLFGPEYIRYPMQPGDKGLVIPADAYLGGMSGLGGGVADLTRRANLSSLVFLPIGNLGFSNVDLQAVTVYGPNGVSLRNTSATSTLILLPTGIALVGENYVTITCGVSTIQMTPTSITLTDNTAHTSPAIMNSAWAALVTWINSHTHPDPQGGVTGAPSSAFTGTSIAP